MVQKASFSLLICFLFILTGYSSHAQECFGVPVREGGGFEMANFDSKGKPTGSLKYKFAGVKQEAGITIVDVELESVSTKGKTEYKQKFSMKCDGNQILVDAASLMMEDQQKSFESFNMTFESNDVVYPNALSVGLTLPEASLKGKGDMTGIPVTLDMKVSDRKVTSREKITVGAGEFDAYKITSTIHMTTKTIANISFQVETVSYRAPGVLWDIKSETYRKGKLVSRSELTRIY